MDPFQTSFLAPQLNVEFMELTENVFKIVGFTEQLSQITRAK